MKKLLMSLFLIFLLMLGCCGVAEEANFYTIRYDRLDIIQSKKPGVDIQIVSNRMPLEYFKVFTGWSETPGASVPDYLPGDTYSEDRDLMLYAAFTEANPLGEISGSMTLLAKSLCKTNTDAYHSFTVSESGYYRFTTIGNYRNTYTPTICMRNTSGNRVTLAEGAVLYNDSYQSTGFTITAKLEAGKTYFLCFDDPGTDVMLRTERTTHFTITYDRVDTTQTKEPGVDIQIISNRKPLEYFKAFTGWSETPGASVPDFLPGDTYSEDRDLTLYAAFADANPLGEISGGMTVLAKSLCKTNTDVYHSFTVSKTDYYRFTTEGTYSNTYTPMICRRSASGSRTDSVEGTVLYDNFYRSTGFTITAKLEAGNAYYLTFDDPGVDVKLRIDTDFYVITYDRLDVIQAKDPGAEIQIINNRKPLADFKAFTGWSETPNASVPDFLPGDTYSEDRDLALYAAFANPNPLGEITGVMSVTANSVCKTDTNAYHSFTVSESGYYSFTTEGNYPNIGRPTICERNSYGNHSNRVEGTQILDDYYRSTGFSIAANLKAGITYYLYFTDPGLDVTLLVEPQYSDPNPYTASSAVPRSVSVIADSAFEGCGFESFQVPAGTTSIGARAFANCPNLRKVVISSANVTIADDAFAGCTDLLIVAPKNSTAHQYAKAHGLEFRALP